jgi:hypothetical protein
VSLFGGLLVSQDFQDHQVLLDSLVFQGCMEVKVNVDPGEMTVECVYQVSFSQKCDLKITFCTNLEKDIISKSKTEHDKVVRNCWENS